MLEGRLTGSSLAQGSGQPAIEAGVVVGKELSEWCAVLITRDDRRAGQNGEEMLWSAQQPVELMALAVIKVTSGTAAHCRKGRLPGAAHHV